MENQINLDIMRGMLAIVCNVYNRLELRPTEARRVKLFRDFYGA